MIQAELLTETTVSHFQRMLLDSTYGFQEKHNGHRLIVCKQNGKLSFFNREGQPSTKRVFLPLQKILLAHPLPTFVIDCELVKNLLFIFDALYLGDEELVHDAYEYREARYHAEFSHYAYILPVATARTPKEKKELWLRVEKLHGEGIVSKNLTASYKMGEAKQHLKLKFLKSAEAVVIGLSPEGKDSVEIGMWDEYGRMHRISGLSLRNKYHVKPGAVLEVKFLYATKKLHIVQPVLVRVRTDKKAVDCKLTQLVPYINKNWVKNDYQMFK